MYATSNCTKVKANAKHTKSANNKEKQRANPTFPAVWQKNTSPTIRNGEKKCI